MKPRVYDLEARAAAARARYAVNPERRRSQNKAWHEANPGLVKAINKAWRMAHPEYIRTANDAWKAANPETYRAGIKAWEAANPERVRAGLRKNTADRRARLAEAFVESVDPDAVFIRDAGVCQICDTFIGNAKWHIDHVHPLSKGGGHSYANTQLAHAFCNMSKHNKMPA